jgi:uncharacterized membrane protein
MEWPMQQDLFEEPAFQLIVGGIVLCFGLSFVFGARIIQQHNLRPEFWPKCFERIIASSVFVIFIRLFGLWITLSGVHTLAKSVKLIN